MATRMQKYYKSERADANTGSRSTRNKDLYGEIYTGSKYSNIEGIASIDNANEVDITKVKEMLKNRENYQKERQYRRITGEYKPEKPKPVIQRTFTDMEEKNYDIRDILKEAKENKEPDDKERVLRNTEYNILKNIDLKKEIEKENYKEDYKEEGEEELKDLIQTITNTSMLNKIKDEDLAADLLSDLQDDDTQIGEIKDIKSLIENDEAYKESKKVDVNEPTYDRSFFTSSLKLSKADFEGEGKKKGRVLNFIIVFILITAIVVSSAMLIMNMF